MAKKHDAVNQPVPAEIPEAESKKKNVPVSSPVRPVQLTPIIQPIAFVPYSTQDQPLYMYDEEEVYEEEVADDETYYDDEEEYVAAAPAKKKASAAAIIVALFSLVILGIYVVAKWVAVEYIGLLNETSGLDIIINFFGEPEWTDITTLAVILVAVFAVLTFIGALVGVMRKGVNLFAKITTALALVAALVTILMSVIGDNNTVGYGLYAVAVVCLINVLISWLAANESK